MNHAFTPHLILATALILFTVFVSYKVVLWAKNKDFPHAHIRRQVILNAELLISRFTKDPSLRNFNMVWALIRRHDLMVREIDSGLFKAFIETAENNGYFKAPEA